MAVGLLVPNDTGDVATDHYGIACCAGRYFIATRHALNGPRRSLSVYLGSDSYALTHALDRSRRGIRVLDLCAGSGILGQVTADWAAEVHAVECNTEAAAVSRANAMLNDVEPVWRVHHGDLWEPVAREHFDLVVSNPPYIAVPPQYAYPEFGYAGPDGLDFVRRILERLPSALQPGGRAQLVFETVGGPEPEALGLLRSFAEANPQWSLRLDLGMRVFLTRARLRPLARAVAALQDAEPTLERTREITTETFAWYRRKGRDYIYKAILNVNSSPGQGGGLTVLPLYSPWEPSSVPRVADKVSRKERRQIAWRAPGRREIVLDTDQDDLLRNLEGDRSLEEAVQAANADTPDEKLAQTLADALDLCELLRRAGVLLPASDESADTDPRAQPNGTLDRLMVDLLEAMRSVNKERGRDK